MSEDTKQPVPKNPQCRASQILRRPARLHHPQFLPQEKLAGADAEKAAMVEQAKSRVAAVKESLRGTARSSRRTETSS